MSEGVKHDAGKLRFELLPGDALGEVVAVLNLGAARYGDRNWEKGMSWGRLFGAMQRHAWAWWQGQNRDPETGRSHLAHIACCVLFLLAYELRAAGSDDRPEVRRDAQ